MAQKAIKIKKIRNSVSTSPGTDQFTRLGSRLVLCTAGFASVRSTISRYGVDCQNMQAFTPIAKLESPYRCNRTIRSWKERWGSSTSPIGMAVHEYHLTCVHIHILMNNEFSTLVQSQDDQNSNNKSVSCPRTRLRYSSVTRLQSHKEPLGSRRRSYRRFWPTPLIQWQSFEHQC
jgi:hypothetical protein